MAADRVAEHLELLNRAFEDAYGHFFVDTVTNVDGFWVARCTCSYRTLGFSTAESAQQALERHHLRRMR